MNNIISNTITYYDTSVSTVTEIKTLLCCILFMMVVFIIYYIFKHMIKNK